MGRSLTQQQFITKCKLKHGDKYDYSNTFYLGNNRYKVEIVCMYRRRVEKR